jgi:hypothetical protein
VELNKADTIINSPNETRRHAAIACPSWRELNDLEHGFSRADEDFDPSGAVFVQ